MTSFLTWPYSSTWPHGSAWHDLGMTWWFGMTVFILFFGGGGELYPIWERHWTRVKYFYLLLDFMSIEPPPNKDSFTDLFKTEIIKFNMWYISLISTIWTLWKTWKKHPSCGDTFSKVAGFTKSITPLWVFFTFFNCKNGTKSRKSVSYLLLLYLHCYLYYYSTLLYMELIVS